MLKIYIHLIHRSVLLCCGSCARGNAHWPWSSTCSTSEPTSHESKPSQCAFSYAEDKAWPAKWTNMCDTPVGCSCPLLATVGEWFWSLHCWQDGMRWRVLDCPVVWTLLASQQPYPHAWSWSLCWLWSSTANGTKLLWSLGNLEN